MAYYLVRAYPDHDTLPDLIDRLQSGEVAEMSPFGQELDACLRRARVDPTTGQAVWEEEDHCSPPLAMEKEALLDAYFDEIEVEPVDQGEGWEQIEDLPSLWPRWTTEGDELPGPADIQGAP